MQHYTHTTFTLTFILDLRLVILPASLWAALLAVAVRYRWRRWRGGWRVDLYWLDYCLVVLNFVSINILIYIYNNNNIYIYSMIPGNKSARKVMVNFFRTYVPVSMYLPTFPHKHYQLAHNTEIRKVHYYESCSLFIIYCVFGSHWVYQLAYTLLILPMFFMVTSLALAKACGDFSVSLKSIGK